MKPLSTACNLADDPAIFYMILSLEQLLQHFNIDLKLIRKWMKTSKISLNARIPHKIINFHLKIKMVKSFSSCFIWID